MCISGVTHKLLGFVRFLTFVIQYDHLHTREIIQNKLQIYFQACTPTTHSLIKNQLISHFFSFCPFSTLITATAILNKIILIKIKQKDTTANVLGWGKSQRGGLVMLPKEKHQTVITLVQQVCITLRFRYNWCRAEVSYHHHHFAVKLQVTSSRLPSLTAKSKRCVVKSEPPTWPGAVFLM